MSSKIIIHCGNICHSTRQPVINSCYYASALHRNCPNIFIVIYPVLFFSLEGARVPLAYQLHRLRNLCTSIRQWMANPRYMTTFTCTQVRMLQIPSRQIALVDSAWQNTITVHKVRDSKWAEPMRSFRNSAVQTTLWKRGWPNHGSTFSWHVIWHVFVRFFLVALSLKG